MKQLRYYSDFRSRKGVLCRVEIWQESATVITPKSIVLAGDPIEIEWSEADKLEPVHSSSATLNIISMSDREFIDLYAVDVDSVRLDVYRDRALYWSGSVDPEIFEEPYSFKDRYITSVTFSDFAILDRKNWEGRAIFSLRKVIDTCIAAAGFQNGGIAQYISTKITDSGQPLTLDELFIVSDNFYDEDNEPMTMREVLDETLRPFALRIIQKNGLVHLYDLNAIHANQAKGVIWTNVDAMLEADTTYNNVKVIFSPYADGALVDGEISHDKILMDKPIGASGELIRTDRDMNSPDGFRIVCGAGSEVAGDISAQGGAVLFRIDPEFSGNKEAGVLWGYRLEDKWHPNAAFEPDDVGDGILSAKPIIRTVKKYIGQVAKPENYRLKVTMDVLFDVRYNPFENASHPNEEGNWDRLQNWSNYGYIPISLGITGPTGNKYYNYYNNNIRKSSDYTKFDCQWRENKFGPEMSGYAWLCYYDSGNRKSASGFGGWQANKPIIGWYTDNLPSVFKFMGTGEYMPLPPINGYIEMVVYAGVKQYDNDADNRIRDIWSRSRWLMYKNIKIEIVKANGLDIDKEDVEDTAWINKNAKEGLEIDTIFGTMPEAVPAARGLIFNSDGLAFDQFSRAGHTDRLERLLIGTVYSQYAKRKHILSGTVELIPEFSVLTDKSEPGQYLALSELQYLARDESEIRMVQFDADSYEAIEYK